MKTLHLNQKKIVDEAKRFNVVCCGRRFGKTSLSEELLLSPDDPLNGALNGYPVSYMAPTYSMIMDVWREMNLILYPIIKTKSEVEKRIEIDGGGILDFWSLDSYDTIRGRKYKRVIVDEAASVRHLKEAWQKVIRPTLTDLQGDAFFFSTPKGQNNYFYDLSQREGWGFWQMPSSANPYLKQSEIDAAEAELDPLTFAQEYLASFITENLDSWAYCYKPEVHDGKTEINPLYDVKLCFDFNRNPITCLVVQDYDNHIRCIEQIKLKNSNIYDLCDYVLAKYGHLVMVITGDATGRASSALVKDNLNYYTVIKSKLDLSHGQIKVPSVNPSLEENRVLVNSVLHNKKVTIDKDNCKGLIFDLHHARVLPDGSLDKTDRADPTKQLDALDCFRYYCNTFQRHTLKI